VISFEICYNLAHIELSHSVSLLYVQSIKNERDGINNGLIDESIIIMENGQKEREIGCKAIAQQATGIFLKNLYNHLSNKKKLLGEFILPIMISAIYILTQSNILSS
jgi:hypothetical protein